jgi:predicted AAA+ superfamily ATPase
MNYSIHETVDGIMKNIIVLENIQRDELIDSIWQAAEGALNESIVYAHIVKGSKKSDHVFKYRDHNNREVDAVIINREQKTLKLIEVKSKKNVNPRTVFTNDAKHLFNNEILDIIRVDDSYEVTCAIVYFGDNTLISHEGKSLLLVNIEQFLENYQDLDNYLSMLSKTI